MLPQYLIIIVIYGKKLSESSTIRSLIGFNGFLQGRCRLHIWDNSVVASEKADIESVREEISWAEISYQYNQGENIPLSKLYNLSINLLQENEIMVILDDDSRFDSRLFEVADKSIASHPETDLFLPIVHNGMDIVSPAAMILFKGHYLKDVKPGIMPCQNRTAINSGMMIRAGYLKHVFEGYDERIRFYFTDNDFMDRYKSSHKEFYVLNYHIDHTLNFYARGEDYTSKSRRFRELRRSFLILMRRRSFLAYISTQLYMIVYSIKFAIIHRDIRYIFVF